ncbi:MAG: PTS sugar transporter subunit IIA, partial [Rhodospirillales bacterium]|nr:PTS sugar transporter subunit IIA [Rhodospirillales bacterium]
MEISELLEEKSVIPTLHATSKKHVLQKLAERASEILGLHERFVLDVLLERERLGPTSVGNGVAIPQGKLPNLKGIHGIFARLAKPVDFDSFDGQPVDLVFLLLSPESAGAG